MNPSSPELTTIPDADLVSRTREGDRSAYSELWRRYAGPARAAALSFTTSFDPDDLVAEAFTRIYRAIINGGGPSTAFRAYLVRTVQNIAVSWSRRRAADPLDNMDELADPKAGEVANAKAVDRDLITKAFTMLPERWQEVLWYTEVDGRKPREIAPELGMTPNTVSALAYRAKEGLRQAWIQAHLASGRLDGDHRWTVERLGAHARGKVAKREQIKIDAHLRECSACMRVAAESKRIASVLPWALLPLVGGMGAVTMFLGSSAHSAQMVASVRPSGIRRISNRFSAASPNAQLIIGSLVVVTGAALGGAVVALSSSLVTLPESSAVDLPRAVTPSATSGPSPVPLVVTNPDSDGSTQQPPVRPISPSPESSPTPTPPVGSDVISASPPPNTQPTPTPVSDPTQTPKPAPSSTSHPTPGALSSPTVLLVDTGTGAQQNLLYPIVSGTAEPHAVITLTNGTSADMTVTADPDGSWSTEQLTGFGHGAYILSVTQTTVTGSTSPPATTRVTVKAPPSLFAAAGSAGLSIFVLGSAPGSIRVLTDQSMDWGVHELIPGFLGTYGWGDTFTWIPSPGLHEISVQYVFGDRSGPPRTTVLPFS